MSDYEQHIGKLIPHVKYNPEYYPTTLDIKRNFLKEQANIDVIEDDDIEDKWYNTDFADKYYIFNHTLYLIEKKEVDAYDDIIEADINEDNSISFVLRFYNGGACFSECLDKAIEKINNDKL